MFHTTTPSLAETEAREFAAQFPTANVLRGIELAEAGRVGWGPLRDLFARSLGDAVQAVA